MNAIRSRQSLLCQCFPATDYFCRIIDFELIIFILQQRLNAAADVFYLLPIAGQLMQEAEASGWLSAALDECRMTQLRRQEVVDPKEAWRDISNAWQLRTRQLACLQLLADWRLRKARERDLAVPEQISIAGFHGLEMGRQMIPSLASVITPRFDIGRIAAQMLLSKIKNNDHNHNTVDLGYQIYHGNTL